MVLDGDHPWVVVAAPGAAKVFSAVTHSSSAFHNNQIQQEKISFVNIPSLLKRPSNVIGGAFAANMQMCQLCWKRVQETMPNSARLKVGKEGLTEPGGS